MNAQVAADVVCVIPTHDRVRELRRAIESVVMQSLPVHEVVVVDDIGSDVARAVVESFADHHNVKYVDSSALPVRGAAVSRNLGAELATQSALIAFLDDDDYWHENFVKQCVGVLQDSSVDLVATWAAMRVGESVVAHVWRASERVDYRSALVHNPGVTGSNMMLRRKVFHALGGFDPGQWALNDLDFFVRFLRDNRPYRILTEDLVVQTSDGGSHLSSRSERRSQALERYLAIHGPDMSRPQKRSMKRQIASSRLYPGQEPGRRLFNVIIVVMNMSVASAIESVARRLKRDAAYRPVR